MKIIFVFYFVISVAESESNATCLACFCLIPATFLCPNISTPEPTTPIMTPTTSSTTTSTLPTTLLPTTAQPPLIYNELDCVFPFRMYGVLYDKCVSFDNGSSFWCSLDSVYTTRAAQCNQSCPVLARNLISDINEVHSSCVEPSIGSIPHFPSKNETKIILDMHNRARSLVKPTAANMKKVTWDIGLARLAQRWAENCDFDHDCALCRRLLNNQTISVGQNAFALLGAVFDPKTFWTDAINFWLTEQNNFNFALGSKTGQFIDVGHYTQIINSVTSKIGCGVADCGGNLHAFCNYALAQKEWQRPYKVGPACSKCAQENCENNLCSCDKLCQNNGILDLTNCECRCLDNFSGKLCQISF
ncbi:cysteine-rich venom latisemin-like isoform X2 [Brachionus plicatilis]|uniref:Cysteine-rich venom latisemin-like isoform X2 n=1 Tax=Brachionus plicatilis TaxID=10195 RepID=A0A3M7QK94_BRAPC|nr:cysteine-rich venom latisemin-like isoform X2 [Brachionus plicatilis]